MDQNRICRVTTAVDQSGVLWGHSSTVIKFGNILMVRRNQGREKGIAKQRVKEIERERKGYRGRSGLYASMLHSLVTALDPAIISCCHLGIFLL
mmetsp:Transcript_21909/g.30584  ORF Transcript_21909/g.30584 Transcript_21909/m.30584 type:complete len:94 (+) Transcript_21909:997-1278(+)